MELKEIRDKIDLIDEQLVKLFSQRMDLSKEVILAKKEKNLPIYNPAREREVLNRVTDLVSKEYETYARVLFSSIFELSRSYQGLLSAKNDSYIEETVKMEIEHFPERGMVACQGVEGAYSTLATEKLFKLPNIMYFKHWEDVFNAVEKGFCKYGVMPIENSSYGSVNGVYDLMINHKFYIVRTIKLHVSHTLLAKEGVKLQDVKEVFSHEQAIGQCSEFLKAHPEIKVTICSNTAESAKMVAESDRTDIAAISSVNCASLYNLKVVLNKVQNSDNNYTRFICISKNLEIYKGANKISLMLCLPHKSGALYSVMSKFNALGINLSKLESRPIIGSDFEFMFYFDIEANIVEENVRKLICELQEELDTFVFLGAYNEL